jgi:hypothetical protein
MEKDYDCAICYYNKEELLSYLDNALYCILCGAHRCMNCMVMRQAAHCEDFIPDQIKLKGKPFISILSSGT